MVDISRSSSMIWDDAGSIDGSINGAKKQNIVKFIYSYEVGKAFRKILSSFDYHHHTPLTELPYLYRPPRNEIRVSGFPSIFDSMMSMRRDNTQPEDFLHRIKTNFGDEASTRARRKISIQSNLSHASAIRQATKNRRKTLITETSNIKLPSINENRRKSQYFAL